MLGAINCMKKLFLLIVFILGVISVSAQNLAVKTNLLYDLTTTLNLGVEYRFSPKWTAEVSGNYNPFTFRDNKKMKHWLVQPEVRYWFCEAFNGHFLGVHGLGGEFNVGDMDLLVFPSFKDYRYEGKMFGAGLSYGYQFVLGKRWNLELSAGAGWIRTDYDKYDCPKCGKWIVSGKKNYFGVTKAAISLIYIIK